MMPLPPLTFLTLPTQVQYQETLPSSDTWKTVINLSDQPLTTTESEVLALGLKFSPKPTNDPTADLASRIQALAKKLPPPIEYSVTQITT